MIKKLKSIVVMLMVCVMVFTTQMVSAATVTLKDINSHWAKTNIEEAVSMGWINGYTDKTFKPDANMTRAEFLKSLIVALNYPLVDEEIPFRDQESWYTPYIATGLKYSIIKAEEHEDEGNFFLPQHKITREEIAIMTVRALGKDPEGVTKGYLTVAKENYIMNGYPDGSMGGEKEATRAEAVVMILNTLIAKNPPKVVTNPKTAKEYDAFVKSLPSFKGITIVSSHQESILINTDGTNNVKTSNMSLRYSFDNKETVVTVYDHGDDSRAIVKDILEIYYPKSYEKAYKNYLDMIDLDTNDDRSMITVSYDNHSFITYKAVDNKTVVIAIGV